MNSLKTFFIESVVSVPVTVSTVSPVITVIVVTGAAVIIVAVVVIVVAVVIVPVTWAKVLLVPWFTDVGNELVPFYRRPVLDKGAVVELQLTTCNIGQFSLYGIVVYKFFVPVAVSQFHVIGYGIGKTLAFFTVFLTEGLIDNHFDILTQVIEAGIPLRIGKPFWFGLQRLSGWYRIRAFYVEFEIRNQKEMVPEFMSEILYIFEVWVEETHKLNQGCSIPLPPFIVFNGQQVVHHLLYMPTILPHDHMSSGCIIFHMNSLKQKYGIF
jgi:hypothetical protein